MTKDIIKNTIVTTILNFFGKAIGYLIPFFIAMWFGVSYNIDVFFYAYSIIFFLTMIFSSSIESIIVPIISEYRMNHDDEKLAIFFGRISVLIFCALSSLLILLFLTNRIIFSTITNFSSDQLNLLELLFVEFTPFVFLLCYTSFFSGILNSYKIFWMPALSPAFRAIICILTMLLFKNSIDLHAIILGYNLGELLRLITFVTYNKFRKIVNLKLSAKFDKEILELFTKASFLVLGTLVVGMNPVIDNSFASWLPIGSVSLLEYSNRLTAIPYNFITYGFLVVFLPYLSDNLYKEGFTKYKTFFYSYIKKIALISIIMVLLLSYFSENIVNLFYGLGKGIPKDSLLIISNLFSISMIGFLPYIITQVFVRGFLALKATKFLFYMAIWKFFLNITLDFIFIKIWKIYGIMIATTVLNYILLFVTIFYFKKACYLNYNQS